MAEDPIPLSEQARYHLGASDIPVDAAFEASVDEQVAKSSVNPSREALLAEGAKQARIHGVDLQNAVLYAEGWAAATKAAAESVADLKHRLGTLTTLERMAHQHASRCDANVAEADARLAGAKAEIARLIAAERRSYADLLDEKVALENRVDELEEIVASDALGQVLDEVTRERDEARERIRKVREIASAAPQNCGCHGEMCWGTNDEPCCTEAALVDARRILAVLDGESEKADG